LNGIETEVLLAHPDFDKPFQIYTDTSDHQLDAVVMHDKKSLAFYSRKLNADQRK
jgi:RNase H-like domain found in reverse transcriptase/Integrase zinc binding domain